MPGGLFVKMRGSLTEHPKVISMARYLKGQAAFRRWHAPNAPDDCQYVSSDAMRCVTVALLMRCWNGSRESGCFVGDDLVLPHNVLADLDDLGGAPCLGEAMKMVGWAVEKNGVTLPNFREVRW